MEFYSNLLLFLANVTARSCALVMVAATLMAVFRIRTAAARHAVWSMATIGMLLLAMLAATMPSIPLRVLRPVAVVSGDQVIEQPAPPAPQPGASPGRSPSPDVSRAARAVWPQVAAALYALGAIFLLARLAFGYLFTVRLVQASRRVELSGAQTIYESAWISVPLTVGWIHPKILLPAGWNNWEPAKLQAVLAHERTHIERRDWALSIFAGCNRCLFWFNPTAWWLERKLASLAEQACDDSALLLVNSEQYAQALLEMAATVKTRQGRLVWEAMAMAKESEVKKRIERILDDTREIPRALTRSRWAAVLACSVPLIYMTSVVRLAAQQPSTPAAMTEYLKGRRQLSAADGATMEQYLTTNPHDLDVRSQLILYYYSNGGREQRLAHILWLIANHPESDDAAFTSLGVSPRVNPLNEPGDYARAAGLWRQQAAAHPNDARVLGNAAKFFAQPGGDFSEAERLLLRARSIEAGNVRWIERLADLYAKAILGSTGDPQFAAVDSAFASKVRAQLENSNEFPLVQMTASRLVGVAMRAPVAAGALNLDDHPLLIPAIDFGGRLMARVGETASLAPQPVLHAEPVYPPLALQARIEGDVRVQGTTGADGRVTHVEVISGHPLLVPAALDAVKKWVFATKNGNFSVAVPFRLERVARARLPVSDDLPAETPLDPAAPQPRSRIEPIYPPLARQARIQGDVRLNVTVGAEGRVTNLEVESGHPLLVPAALQAVKLWIYPTGSPSRFSVTVPFRLDGSSGLASAQSGTIGAVVGGVAGGTIGGIINGVSGGTIGGVINGVPRGVTGGVVGGVPGVPSGENRSATLQRDGVPPVRIRVGGRVQGAKLIHRVEPVYPAEARAAGISGTVTLEITIGPEGRVETAKPVDGHPLLAAAAQEAVKQWAYQPTLLQGKPVDQVITTVTLTFDSNH